MRVPSILALATLACIALAPVTSAWEGTCQAPLLATQGSHPNSVIEHYHIDMGIFAHDEDWWLLTVPPGSAATASLVTTPFYYVTAGVYDATSSPCGGALVENYAAGSTFTRYNTTSQPTSYLINVHAGPGLYQSYSLDVNITSIVGCASGGSIDALEPNSFGAARRVTPGLYASLGCDSLESDEYSVRVPSGCLITATTNFVNALGDLDLDLIVPNSTFSSAGTGDVETVGWLSTSSTAVDARIRVHTTVPTFPNVICNQYSLLIRVENPALGTSECTANPNSTGLAASLRAYGSSSLAANNLSFAADGLPATTSCLLFCGPGTAQLPFGGGFLCVSAPRTRIVTRIASASGTADLNVDATASGLQSILAPGVTHHFQALYRDASQTPAFNLTDAYSVTSTP